MGTPNGHDSSLTGTNLTVGVVTYERPETLALLLDELDKVALPRTIEWEDVLVVDNSPEATATGVVEAHDGRFPVRYVHEPTPGIAAARNRVLAEVTTDFVAFIDDDEVPSVGWIQALEATLLADPQALAVVGPVVPVFDCQVPTWIRETGVFDAASLTQGGPPPYLNTGNVLLSTRISDLIDPLFDVRLGLLGGSDHHLGEQLKAKGALLTSAPEAVVHETVPAHRVQRSWVLRRLRRKGSSMAVSSMLSAGGPRDRRRARVRNALAGIARVVVGSVLWIAGPMFGRPRGRGLAVLLRGVGQFGAVLGRPVAEYARPQSSADQRSTE